MLISMPRSDAKAHARLLLARRLVFAAACCIALLPRAAADAEHSGEEEAEPANALLFFCAALAFGIIFRRALASVIIPYTGILLVRAQH